MLADFAQVEDLRLFQFLEVLARLRSGPGLQGDRVPVGG
jgi:hypothetical protein